MKKIIIIFLTLPIVLLLSSCRQQLDPNKVVEKFIDQINTIEQYTLEGKLTITRNDDDVNFDVRVDHLNPGLYKVTLDNVQNNNRQIIIKNGDGVFVLTPALNKVFKFDSQWPLNSSHVYLLSSLAMDIANDDNVNVSLVGNDLVIKTIVNYKTNANLVNQKITVCAKELTLRSVVVFDKQEEIQISFDVKNFNKNPNLRTSHFHVEETLRSNAYLLGQGSPGTVDGTLTVNYLPDGLDGSASDVIDEVTIKTLSGDREVVIVSSATDRCLTGRPRRLFDDLAVFSKGVAAFNENSMEFFHFNKHIRIFSNDLEPHEFINIAASLTWEQEPKEVLA